MSAPPFPLDADSRDNKQQIYKPGWDKVVEPDPILLTLLGTNPTLDCSKASYGMFSVGLDS